MESLLGAPRAGDILPFCVIAGLSLCQVPRFTDGSKDKLEARFYEYSRLFHWLSQRWPIYSFSREIEDAEQYFTKAFVLTKSNCYFQLYLLSSAET